MKTIKESTIKRNKCWISFKGLLKKYYIVKNELDNDYTLYTKLTQFNYIRVQINRADFDFLMIQPTNIMDIQISNLVNYELGVR